MTNIVAIGDVHGHYKKLVEAVEPHFNSNAEFIFIGDLFDRAEEPDGDLKVLTYVRELQDNPENFGLSKVTVLKGNHEDMLIKVIKTDDTELWEYNGGDINFLDIAREHLDWLESLPLYAERGQYLFVHAGVRPDVPLEEQADEDLIWIRDPFLNGNDHHLPYIVVHGHTPTPNFEVEVLPHRIGIDTGACFGGTITALPLEY